MRNIKQCLKIFLTELLDFNFVLILTNLTLILGIVIGSNKYGDFIQFLQHIENHLQIAVIILFAIILFIYILIKIIFPSIMKKTIGQAFFYTQYLPKSNINILNLFLFNITGPIINVILFPISIYRAIKGLPSIGSFISGLQNTTTPTYSYIKAMIGILVLFLLMGFNIFAYKNNIYFNIGKHLTNYARLMDYAIDQQNPEMLEYFINEYKHRADHNPAYYECMLSLLKNGINEQICSQALNEDTNNLHQQNLHKYIGLHYLALKDYKNASKYLEFFFTKKIISEELINYLYAYQEIDTSYNHKNTINKINKLYKDIKDSNKPIVQYKLALILFDNQQFDKTIELLTLLLKKNSPKLDKSELLWYLGEALFLNKKYKDGLKYMEQAQQLNQSQYKTLYDSYVSYYKTQIKNK